MTNKNQANVESTAIWVRANKYMEMTGHNVNTLKKLRFFGHLKENRHYKFWPEGCTKTIYYNTRAIDNLISQSKS